MNKQSAAARWLVFSKRSTFVDPVSLGNTFVLAKLHRLPQRLGGEATLQSSKFQPWSSVYAKLFVKWTANEWP